MTAMCGYPQFPQVHPQAAVDRDLVEPLNLCTCWVWLWITGRRIGPLINRLQATERNGSSLR
jgi:hypothetical protein